MHVLPGDFSDPRVIELLRLHAARARAETAPGSAHALDISGLQTPDVSFWTIWDGDALLGLGAWKRLSAEHGEIKSIYRRHGFVECPPFGDYRADPNSVFMALALR